MRQSPPALGQPRGLNVSPASVGLALVIAGAVSVQFGAALATSLMPALGLWFVLLFRYAVMAATHWTLSYKHVRQVPGKTLLWGLVVAVPLLAMNTSIYAAFSRIGIGLGVTIELLGPIGLAIIASRSTTGWALGLLTFVGLVLVAGPTLSTDPLGIAFALTSAFFWALYLVASKRAGEKLPGLLPLAIASGAGLLVLIPLNLVFSRGIDVTWWHILIGIAAGLTSSAIPYAADLLALRRLPMHVASNLMSLHPVCAALWGAAILGERLGPLEVAGLIMVCLANVLVVNSAARERRRQVKQQTLMDEAPSSEG